MAAVPEIITFYADGSAALAADFYEDERELARAAAKAKMSRFLVESVIPSRETEITRALLWSTKPLETDEPLATVTRLEQVVQSEVALPYRETITANSLRDPASVGWRRIAAGGCKFCRLLADRGAVYREATARFASHPGCGCSAAPVFDGKYGTDVGEEASAMQYVASKRKRTSAQQQQLRDYLAAMPD